MELNLCCFRPCMSETSRFVNVIITINLCQSIASQQAAG